METLIKISIELSVGGLCAACALLLAYGITEYPAAPLFNTKPFNCWPCAAFWLTLLIGAVALIWVHALSPSTVILCAFINFIYLSTKIKIVK